MSGVNDAHALLRAPGDNVKGNDRITLHQLVQLDATEGMRYRHVLADAEDKEGRPMRAVSYIAAGKETDGNTSLCYLTLLREGARAHGLPRHWIAFLEKIEHAH